MKAKQVFFQKLFLDNARELCYNHLKEEQPASSLGRSRFFHRRVVVMKKRLFSAVTALLLVVSLISAVPVYAHGSHHQDSHHQEESDHHTHHYETLVTQPGSCTTWGSCVDACTVCGQYKPGSEREIPPCHSYCAWETTRRATVFAPAQQCRTCQDCGDTQTRTRGKCLTPKLVLSEESLTLKTGEKCTSLKVTSMARGDSLKSVTSDHPGIVKVSRVKPKGGCVLKAGKKTGEATLTLTLASGEQKTVTVTVFK